MEKRADVMAKLLLLEIYNEEHRKLKQAWKNDSDYQEMLKNEKKLKSEMEP
jgi:Fe-S cluster biosynthesis and repair protein YggX